jgi:hypothetical protein
MLIPSLPSRLPAFGARLLVTVATLAGLFAMHGLADHGVPTPPIAAAHTTAMGEGHHSPDPGTPSGHETAEVCLALLALAFVLVLALGGVGLLVRATGAARMHGRVLAVRARLRDPPDLFRLSVQRC